MAKGQLAKLLIEGDNYTILSYPTMDNLLVSTAWRIGANPDHIMPAHA